MGVFHAFKIVQMIPNRAEHHTWSFRGTRPIEMVLVANISLHLSHYFQQTLREKCPNTESFLVRTQSECGKIRARNYSVFGHFLRSESIFICSTHHSNFKLQ